MKHDTTNTTRPDSVFRASRLGTSQVDPLNSVYHDTDRPSPFWPYPRTTVQQVRTWVGSTRAQWRGLTRHHDVPYMRAREDWAELAARVYGA